MIKEKLNYSKNGDEEEHRLPYGIVKKNKDKKLKKSK